MPGGIDPHTHLSMPFMGQVTCDDFYRQVELECGRFVLYVAQTISICGDYMLFAPGVGKLRLPAQKAGLSPKLSAQLQQLCR